MAAQEILDRASPDGLCTADLPLVLAAEVDHLAGRHAPWQLPRCGVHAAIGARALAAVGRAQEARAVLADCAGERWTPHGAAAAAWAASRSGDPGIAAELRAALGSCDEFVVDDDVPLGPRALFEALLDAAAGDLDAAVVGLETAAAVGDSRAPVWGALARLEAFRVRETASLLDPSAPQVGHRSLLVSARAFFAASGHRYLRDRCDAYGAPPGSRGGEAEGAVGHPGLGILVERDGEWAVGFGVQPSTPVRASKGLVALRHLIENRHRPVPAVELDAVVSGTVGADAITSGALVELVEAVSDGPDTFVGLDDAARELLVDDAVRSRVTKLLRRTLGKISGTHAVAGAHLASQVETGYLCRYEATEQVRWRF